MGETIVDKIWGLWSVIIVETEFWSAIFGALVGAVAGGFIAYMVQVKALREGRKQRDEDHRRLQRALGHALIFKMIRIHSNFFGIHQHFEEGLAQANQNESEPWECVMPLANPPDPVQFSSDEMGMLLALKNDDLFNLLHPMDVRHNSLIEVVKVLNTDRTALIERLPADQVEGTIVSADLNPTQLSIIRPKMNAVNTIIKYIHISAAESSKESRKALVGLQKLLSDEIDLTLKLEFDATSNDPSAI